MTESKSPEWWPALLDDIQAEHSDLDTVVSQADEAAWLAATPAEGWDVRDCIGHLAYFDWAARLAIQEPDEFEAHVNEALAGTFNPVDEHLERSRSMPAREVLSWWREERAALLGTLRILDPGERIAWYGPSMGARSFVTARLMETWAHGQDVCDALGATRVPTVRLRHIADLGFRTRGFSYVVRGREAPATAVRVELVGPGGEDWSWGDEGAANLVSGPALDFCLTVTQRINVADTMLIVKGDEATEWMGIAQAFAGPPGPGRPPKRAA